MSYFIEELAIKEHFTAMRQFLLLEDGEFGHVLANALFEEVAHSDSAVRLSSAIFLNPLLTKALQHSMYGDSPYASRLSFQLKYQPTAIRSTSELYNYSFIIPYNSQYAVQSSKFYTGTYFLTVCILSLS